MKLSANLPTNKRTSDPTQPATLIRDSVLSPGPSRGVAYPVRQAQSVAPRDLICDLAIVIQGLSFRAGDL